jgi:hypothetical protein
VGIDVRAVRPDQAARQVNELAALYREVYAEAPYCWGEEHAELSSAAVPALASLRLDVMRSSSPLVSG